jgi:lipoate-protein ligase A
MKFLDLTLPTPAENLACDETLLDWCEETGDAEVLRVWEPAEYFVVVGYANKVQIEVNSASCRKRKIPILRRCSGGGTVVQGQGCLNYSLILKIDGNQSLHTITKANRFIMERHRDLLRGYLGGNVEVEGHTDLTVGALKFSGNAQRRKKQFLLFHGTFLLNFDIPMIAQLLNMPSHQPEYRKNRSHEEFLTNLNRSSAELKSLLRREWKASADFFWAPDNSKLLMEKYLRDDWNFKH